MPASSSLGGVRPEEAPDAGDGARHDVARMPPVLELLRVRRKLRDLTADNRWMIQVRAGHDQHRDRARADEIAGDAKYEIAREHSRAKSFEVGRGEVLPRFREILRPTFRKVVREDGAVLLA